MTPFVVVVEAELTPGLAVGAGADGRWRVRTGLGREVELAVDGDLAVRQPTITKARDREFASGATSVSVPSQWPTSWWLPGCKWRSREDDLPRLGAGLPRSSWVAAVSWADQVDRDVLVGSGVAGAGQRPPSPAGSHFLVTGQVVFRGMKRTCMSAN
jgi:hypothetical protein